MPGRGNTVIYGKITISSEIESMDSVCKHLSEILKEHGYPADGNSGPQKDAEVKEAEMKLKELMASNGDSQSE
jgi:exo-beta-1,3-glucanase (GH17 family)